MGKSSYFKEAHRVTQTMYGGYCNKVRQAGLEPMPYHRFTNRNIEKKDWIGATTAWKNGTIST